MWFIVRAADSICSELRNTEVAMSLQEKFAVVIRCAKCGQRGTAIWKGQNPIHRTLGDECVLSFVSTGFSLGREVLAQLGRPEIICDRCDEVQAD
jgi:hypothetical protein